MSDLSFLNDMRRAERRRRLRQRFQLIIFFALLLIAAVAVDWAMESLLFSIITLPP